MQQPWCCCYLSLNPSVTHGIKRLSNKIWLFLWMCSLSRSYCIKYSQEGTDEGEGLCRPGPFPSLKKKKTSKKKKKKNLIYAYWPYPIYIFLACPIKFLALVFFFFFFWLIPTTNFSNILPSLLCQLHFRCSLSLHILTLSSLSLSLSSFLFFSSFLPLLFFLCVYNFSGGFCTSF
jgi:hypothetical protein